MSDEDIEEVIKSGERLPTEMWEPDMLETFTQELIFDGEKIVAQGG